MGYTPLEVAAGEGHLGLIRVLVAAGADVRSRNNCEGTPLHLAAEGGQSEAIRELVLVGACVKDKTTSGDTALHGAATPSQRSCHPVGAWRGHQ